ncbi:hypothetical protein EZS27_008330 [termite gut metagenome]|uniref:N-acetyltransferase domain-containing protein n=1 Tax=termite gut metagenome TaxID=433724 RepID=A0A5J4SFG0_9ZZZZ
MEKLFAKILSTFLVQFRAYWKQGYCVESVKACMKFACERLNLKELYCLIRPENEASIRISEKTGMKKTGEHTKIYGEKRCCIGCTV